MNCEFAVPLTDPLYSHIALFWDVACFESLAATGKRMAPVYHRFLVNGKRLGRINCATVGVPFPSWYPVRSSCNGVGDSSGHRFSGTGTGTGDNAAEVDQFWEGLVHSRSPVLLRGSYVVPGNSALLR